MVASSASVTSEVWRTEQDAESDRGTPLINASINGSRPVGNLLMVCLGAVPVNVAGRWRSTRLAVGLVKKWSGCWRMMRTGVSHGRTSLSVRCLLHQGFVDRWMRFQGEHSRTPNLPSAGFRIVLMTVGLRTTASACSGGNVLELSRSSPNPDPVCAARCRAQVVAEIDPCRSAGRSLACGRSMLTGNAVPTALSSELVIDVGDELLWHVFRHLICGCADRG